MRWAIVAAAVLVMLAAVPLYQNSRRELAPIEDQSHISLFMAASPDASLEATNKASLQVVKAVTSFPEAKFMWSLTANWGEVVGMGRAINCTPNTKPQRTSSAGRQRMVHPFRGRAVRLRF